jgi:hypothetical protein
LSCLLTFASYKLRDWEVADWIDWAPLVSQDDYMSLQLYAQKCDPVTFRHTRVLF